MAAYEIVGELEEGAAAAARAPAGLERRGGRVRLVVDGPPGAALEALLEAGARGVEVREYPDAAARAAWSDWAGGAGAGFRREETVVGGRPRLFVPLLATALVALSLERLGALHPVAAALLFLLLALFVLANEARRARLRVRFVRYVAEPEEG